MIKSFTMKLLLLSLLLPITLPIWSTDLSFGYPDVHGVIGVEFSPTPTVDTEKLMDFLDQWDASFDGVTESFDSKLTADSATVAQLESVYRIQTAQLEQLRREAKPVLSIITDPSNPIYGFSRIRTETPPGSGTTQTTIAHTFGIGAGLSQQLATAGSIDVSLKHNMSYASGDGGSTYSWEQNPSIGFTFQQPLGIGDRLIDGSYGRKIEEKQILQQTSAAEAVATTSGELAVQIMQLYHTRQALLESRWLLSQQISLSKETLENAEFDYAAGLISRNQVLEQELALRELVNQVKQLEMEIESLESSIHTISGLNDMDSLANLALIPLNVLDRVLLFAGETISQDDQAIAVALINDTDYTTAERELRIALLDRDLGNPGDAPRLSVSLQLSPFYTVTAGNSLWDSVDSLFTSASPNFSVSVSFLATDLSRSLSRTTAKLVDEKIIQATISKNQARSAVVDRLAELQRETDSAVAKLSLLMDSYTLAVTDVEVEQIKADAGISDRSRVKRAQLGMYEAAFAILQQLRTLRLIDAQLSLLVPPNYR
ncbi:TolC family protein [Pleomorphochaeta sp. DL1XJH-081]|uniref:TolC family protein n=1 Tax=Pleomorphochaeta sp. DL1XJH-081 TaxID=3409690 RepID=UPI003BB7A8DA